ncbi:MAG: hypothetical protein LUH07_08935 [Lachnospiraceae bacterium]|nr:hypothetical protein [Lachnospiraceae bacterium]
MESGNYQNNKIGDEDRSLSIMLKQELLRRKPEQLRSYPSRRIEGMLETDYTNIPYNPLVILFDVGLKEEYYMRTVEVLYNALYAFELRDSKLAIGFLENDTVSKHPVRGTCGKLKKITPEFKDVNVCSWERIERFCKKNPSTIFILDADTVAPSNDSLHLPYLRKNGIILMTNCNEIPDFLQKQRVKTFIIA